MIYNYLGNVVEANIPVVNVMAFGAKGDGSTNDATAIQEALDSVKNTGGIIYFPKGTYRLNTAVHFYSLQTLWFDEGAVLLQGASISNLLRTYCESTWTEYNGTHDCLIHGGTFDGGSYTTNNTLIGTAHAKNITFENCTLKNAYGSWHNIEINSSYNVKVINCDFEGSRKNDANGEMIQIDGAINSGVYPWDNYNADGTGCKYIEIFGCLFHSNAVSPAIGNHSTGATHSFVRIHDNVFDGLTSTRGAISFWGGMTNCDIYSNTFNGCTKGIVTVGTDGYIYENRFVDVTTVVNGTANTHNNMINGTYTA